MFLKAIIAYLRSSKPFGVNTEKLSEKNRSQCANISDEEFNWNELDKDSVINTDHKKEKFHQGATTRKRKVKKN